MNCPEVLRPLHGKLVVSCQAWEDDPFYGSENMVRFACAAVAGGAAGIRANGPEDIRAIRAAVSVPIIGLQKRTAADGRILITPAFEDARSLRDAGADAVALDCTARGCVYGALDRLRRIRHELGIPVIADIATLEEAEAAQAAGAGLIACTMRGYTEDTADIRIFDPEFIAALVRAVRVPVIAEGRIWTVEDAVAAVTAGAFAAVIGSAITRPRDITARFAEALNRSDASGHVVGIDIGGTRIKSGVVAPDGQADSEGAEPTWLTQGRAGLLNQIGGIAEGLIESARRNGRHPAAVGIATAGWIDARSGRVVYATPNLPEWTDTPIAQILADRLGLPVFAENDANALAVGEKRFGTAHSARNFVCITLGTGVGGGCYIDGQLRRGAHSMANAIGHLPIYPGGLPCTCGRTGCLEPYTNAAALVRYAGDSRYSSAQAVIQAAHSGDDHARGAVRMLAAYLARGCALVVDLLDPELIVLSGGLAQDNPLLLAEVEASLCKMVTVWHKRRLAIRASSLGYSGGVVGAAAVAFERLADDPYSRFPRSS